jgi:hypothetical protein
MLEKNEACDRARRATLETNVTHKPVHKPVHEVGCSLETRPEKGLVYCADATRHRRDCRQDQDQDWNPPSPRLGRLHSYAQLGPPRVRG